MRTHQPSDLIADRYELCDEIGRGGSGVVWRAQDRLLERVVAIKAVDLSRALGDSDPRTARTRVLREGRAAARLSHPSVTGIYDVLDEHEVLYLVMEHVDAPSLDEVVRRDGPLAAADAARIGAELLDALDAAHRRGIVHRDVKPANVLVPGGSPIKLTDFGIASVAQEAGLTITGTLVGSPPYMAPEQANGEQVTPATDLWGVGATLYFAVEGVPPFDRGQPLATLNAVLHDTPRPPHRAGALAPVLERLLTKAPADRPSVAEARRLLADLQAPPAAAAATQVLPRPAPTAPVPAPVADPVEGPRRGAGWAAAVLGVVVVFGLIGWVLVGALLGGDAPGSGRPPDADGAADAAGATGAPGGTGLPPAEAPAVAPHAEDAPADQAAPVEPRAPVTPADPAPAIDDDRADAPEPDEPERDEEDDAASDDALLPAQWTLFPIGPGGARVGHPEGWTARRRGGTVTDLQDPAARGTYLRTDWTDSPRGDPVADWRQQSAAFAERHEGYEELRIEPTRLDGHEAAIWEYRYTAGGLRLRAINVAIVADGYGYALNYQTTEDRWVATADVRDWILASFRA